MTSMERRDIAIIGSGGLAREVRWLIEDCNRNQNRWNVLGWISMEKPGTMVAGLPVLGNDDWLVNYDAPIDVAVSVGSGALRKKIVSYLRKNDKIAFPIIISPSAEVSESVVLGAGSIISAKSILTVDIEIGDFFFCNLACTVGHDCRFSNFVTLNPGANVSGNVTLGECVTIGTGASINQGLSVGENATIGASAAVVRNIDANCTAVGIPAKPLEKKK